jgi:uncharacterized RDD family membrane protein YckC
MTNLDGSDAAPTIPNAVERPVSSTGSGAHSTRNPRILQVRAAGFGRRLVAGVVDGLLVAAVATGVTAAAAVVLGVPLPTMKEFGPDFVLAGLLDRNPMAVGAVGLLIGIGALYHIYLGGMLGQTAGKRLMGLRVISSRGTSPGPILGILRFTMLVFSVLPAGLGWVWCLFDRERRALHDHLSGTYVIIVEPR